MDDFKLNLLRDLIQDAITNTQRGETVYGTEQDQEDALEALRELQDELLRTGKLGTKTRKRASSASYF